MESWFKQYFSVLFILLPARLLLTWLKENWWIDIKIGRKDHSSCVDWLLDWFQYFQWWMKKMITEFFFLQLQHSFFVLANVVKCRWQLLAVWSSSSTIVFVIRRLCLDTFLLTGSSNADPFVLIEVKTLTYFIFLIILSIQKNTETKTRRTNNT